MNENNSLEIDPKVRKIDLERIAWKVGNDPYKPEMSDYEIYTAIHQYRRYLTLKIRYPSANLVPTDEIDMIWHTHILDTENYAADCEKLFGKFLHHQPYFGDHSDETQEDMNEFFGKTSQLWENEFGEQMKQPEIFRCAGKACHAPTSCRCR
jgi:hypothetical protein